jgi:hypothetical protein
MSSSAYFDYRGKLSSGITNNGPSECRYVVEVSKKDGDGLDRNPLELRAAAYSMLHNGLSESLASALENAPRPPEIEKTSFDALAKAKVYSTLDGTIYKITQQG